MAMGTGGAGAAEDVERKQSAEPRWGWRSKLFTFFVTAISRALMLRDSVLGVARRMPQPRRAEQLFFESGGRSLAAVWVDVGDAAPVILLCHGIGETVEHWSGVQAFLEERGVSSMVFNYSGYGRSEGAVSWKHCDEDLVSAYREVRRRVGDTRVVWVLGFSMGSGIAASGVGCLKPPVAGLILCEAFSSFREATCAAWVPRMLAQFGPEIWDSVEAVKALDMPVCVVHSDGDGLFPVEMGRRIAEAAAKRGELVVVHGFTHNEIYLKPVEGYWGRILERVRGNGRQIREV